MYARSMCRAMCCNYVHTEHNRLNAAVNGGVAIRTIKICKIIFALLTYSHARINNRLYGTLPTAQH